MGLKDRGTSAKDKLLMCLLIQFHRCHGLAHILNMF